MGERNTAWLMQQWGLWVRFGTGANLRAKSVFQNLLPASDWEYVQPMISDDDALMVDALMAKIKVTRHDQFRLLWLVFVEDFSMREVSDRLKISRDRAAKDYESAYSLIDVGLNYDSIFTATNENLQAA